MMPLQFRTVAPQQQYYPQQVITQPVASQQLDVSQLFNMIMPIMALSMVFGMLTPMIKQFGDMNK